MLKSPGTGLVTPILWVSSWLIFQRPYLDNQELAWWECYFIGIGKYRTLELCPPSHPGMVMKYLQAFLKWAKQLQSMIQLQQFWTLGLLFYNYPPLKCHRPESMRIMLASQLQLSPLALNAKPGCARNFNVYDGSDFRNTRFHIFLPWSIESWDASESDFNTECLSHHFSSFFFLFEIVLAT